MLAGARRRCRRSLLPRRGFDLRQDHGRELLGADGADLLEADDTLAVDDEALGHAIDPPFDRRAAAGIGADRGIGIAQAAEKAAGVLRIILVVDANEAHARA